jgi:hypothetical protein
VCDRFLLGCGEMVVSTLSLGCLKFSWSFALVSAVCNGLLLGFGVMVSVCPWFPPLGVVGTYVPIVTSFFEECNAILRFDGRKIC